MSWLALAAVALRLASALIVFDNDGNPTIFPHATAEFGAVRGVYDVQGELDGAVGATSLFCDDADLGDGSRFVNRVAVARRGSCSFHSKAMRLQSMGAVAVVIGNDEGDHDLVSMATGDPDAAAHIVVPVVSVSRTTLQQLERAKSRGTPDNVPKAIVNDIGEVRRGPGAFFGKDGPAPLDIASFVAIALMILLPAGCVLLATVQCIKRSCSRRHVRRAVANLPVHAYDARDTRLHNETCAVCLEEFVPGEPLRALPCRHGFHVLCIDPWLREHSDLCPICKRSVRAKVGGRRRPPALHAQSPS